MAYNLRDKNLLCSLEGKNIILMKLLERKSKYIERIKETVC